LWFSLSALSYTLKLRTQLKQAFEHSALPDAELAEYLAKIQRDVVVSLGSVLDGEGE
jgi:DNA mismatch repair protein MSH4